LLPRLLLPLLVISAQASHLLQIHQPTQHNTTQSNPNGNHPTSLPTTKSRSPRRSSSTALLHDLANRISFSMKILFNCHSPWPSLHLLFFPPVWRSTTYVLALQRMKKNKGEEKSGSFD
jgi:hypothetical protein